MKLKYVAYTRVSTDKQGKRGLGMQAQKEIIKYNVREENIIAWYEEVKSGKNIEALPQLQKAKDHARKEKAILVIAKADRLRNTQQALDLVDEMSPEKVFFCNVGRNADKFTLTLFFAFAEKERLEISIRTKAALARLKAKGVKLGRYTHKGYKKKGKNALKTDKEIEMQKKWADAGALGRKKKSLQNENNKKAFAIAVKMRLEKKSYKQIADFLNTQKISTATGGGTWSTGSVFNLIKRFTDFPLPLN